MSQQDRQAYPNNNKQTDHWDDLWAPTDPWDDLWAPTDPWYDLWSPTDHWYDLLGTHVT